MKERTKRLLDLGSSDRNDTNVLRPRRFKLCDFSTNSIYARNFLPVKFFPKYYFSKLCFELPKMKGLVNNDHMNR